MNEIENSSPCNNLPPRDIRNARVVNVWALVWAANLAIITTLPRFDWFTGPLPLTIAFVLSIGFGVGLILAYKRYLTQLDEMERKIQLDALALSVGVTLVVFGAYSILGKAGVAPELQASHLVVVLALTYVVGVIAGRIRYR